MIHRRDAMLRIGQLGLGGALSLPHLLAADSNTQRREGSRDLKVSGGRAKSCILIYLWGGPPQMDMWDPNPLAAQGIRSQFAPINTVVPGIDISEEMPLFARHTDQTAIIRSMSHNSNNHEPSVYRSLTGHTNPSLRVPRNNRTRVNHPNLGSVISALTPLGGMPCAVTIP